VTQQVDNLCSDRGILCHGLIPNPGLACLLLPYVRAPVVPRGDATVVLGGCPQPWQGWVLMRKGLVSVQPRGERGG